MCYSSTQRLKTDKIYLEADKGAFYLIDLYSMLLSLRGQFFEEIEIFDL